jgi:hypothetical protein
MAQSAVATFFTTKRKVQRKIGDLKKVFEQ